MEAFPPEHQYCTRRRGIYALWIAAVICLGLGSRAEELALPAFAAKYTGDALWGLMIFLGLGFLVPTWRTAAVAGLAFVVRRTVEFSQLYRAAWIDAARGTWFGRLALGDTFGWGDIAAYLVGIVSGGVIERAGCRRRIANRAEPSAAPDRSGM